ncbi:MAG: hypothetical protein LJE66_08190 [Desulfobacterales bacterium]|jgi:hypothetical protein|nr:hypothetical protein [Desulfobacterales bacterium]
MTKESFKSRVTASPNLIKAKFYFRLFFVIGILLITAIWMDHWIRGELGVGEKVIEIAKGRWGIGVLITGGMIYSLLLSLPFVPGVELGILLMCVFGKVGIVFVYFATIIGLNLAFLMGRIVPKKWVESLLKKLGLFHSSNNQSDEIVSMLDNFLCNKNWLRNLLLNYRYLVIGILFNMPGIYLIGGGGGISLVCGISRNISFKWFLLTVVLAVSPVPLLVFFGVIQLEALFSI